MRHIYDSFLLAFDGILFISAVSFLILINTIYVKTEDSMNNAINIKNNMTTTYEDCENILQTKINGTTVVEEILMYGNDYEIAINSTVLNNILTPTREPFLDYIQKYDVSLLYRQVSQTNNYLKKCILNHQGKIVRIEYTLIND